MKRIYGRVLLILSSILLLCSSALLNISADPTAIVTVEDRSAAPGRTATVKLSVVGVPEPGLSDLQGSLVYDPKVLNVEKVEGLNNYQVFAYNIDNDLGQVRFVVAKVSGKFLKEGKIIRFEVRAVGQVGDRSLLELDLEAFNDPDGNPIAYRIEDGSFTIKAQQAIFTFQPKEPEVNETVQFIDQSVGKIVRWMWDFGDGTASTKQNPTHKYSAPRTYTVQLLIEDNTGATDITADEITVRPPNRPPQADFSFSPAKPKVGEIVQFTDKSTDPNGNETIASWKWDFGDGSTSSIQNPTHKYSQAGTYTVRLTVTDNEGLSDTASWQIVVSEITNEPPQADFTFSPANPKPGEEVRFTDKSSDPDGQIVAWAWDFGDGSTSTVQSPSHKYSQAGTYTVKLTVTDDGRLTDTASKTILIGVKPHADFSFSPANPKPRQKVQFTDKSSDPDGQIVAWAWDFGDGNSSTEQNPIHKYTGKGTYTVKLTVTDNDGVTDTISKQITVGAGRPTVSVHCFPNPAATQTTFKYQLPSGTNKATLWVFDITGRLVFHHDVAGTEYTWDLKSDAGADLPNGPYFYYIIAYDAQGKRIARSAIGKLVIQRS